MSIADILTAEDMATSRSAADFVAWVRQKGKELSATLEIKRKVWLGAELSTKFYDEIYPLAVFVEREFSNIPEVIVTPNLNSDNYDATIEFKSPPSKHFIEITRAKNGYDESLRMEVLARDGHVCWTGPITKKSGKKGTSERIVEITSEARCRDDALLEKNLSLIETTVKAKSEGRQYGKNFTLLVIVDDYDDFQTESEQAKLDAFVKDKLLLPDLDFALLIILGISGKLKLSYHLPRYNDTVTLLTL